MLWHSPSSTVFITGILIVAHVASMVFFLYTLYVILNGDSFLGTGVSFKLKRSKDEDQGDIELQAADNIERKGTDVAVSQPSLAKALPAIKKTTSNVNLMSNPMS